MVEHNESFQLIYSSKTPSKGIIRFAMYPLFFLFSFSVGQLVKLNASSFWWLVGSSNMWSQLLGITQTCVMVSLIFLRRKINNSCCICPALPPDPHIPAAQEKESSHWLSSLWKGLRPGLWIHLPDIKLLLHRPTGKLWNKLSCSSGAKWIKDSTNP